MPRKRGDMDAAIFGMQRSGTTMLAGLMTYQARRVFNEPGTHGNRHKHMRAMLPTMERWGVKEVRPGLFTYWRKHYKIAKIVFTIRDVRHAAMSTLEGAHRKGVAGPGRLRLQLARLKAVTEYILRIEENDNVRIVRYELFCTDQDYRDRLSEWLDWPFDGDPSFYQELRPVRRFEVERHEHRVTSRSICLRESESRERYLRYGDRAGEMCSRFQKRFYPETSHA